MPKTASATPLVSIIIPCYNAECFVGEAVRSALDQTYPHREVIVVDDGSTDGSFELLKGFGDAIRLKTGPNRGGCAARNRGIEMAKGELLQFHDADDLLHPEKLARQVPLALKHRKAAVYCNYGFIDAEGKPASANGQLAPLPKNEDSVVFVLQNAFISTPGPLLWREDVMSIGGFREHLSCSQERDLHLRLACKGLEFRHLPEELISIRRLDGGVSSNFISILEQYQDIVAEAHRILEADGRLTDERQQALSGTLAKCARCYLRNGQQERGLNYFRLAREMHPDGGIRQAYPKLGRLLHRLIGPVATHRLAALRHRPQ
jgi:glycosyltransferase involved in cell wall biosynthesis